MKDFEASNIATWLEESYTAYLTHLHQGGARERYIGPSSGDWKTDQVRVSKLAGQCPKLAAVRERGQFGEETTPLANIARMDDAVLIAERFYEAITWSGWHNVEVVAKAQAEFRVAKHWTGLVGTIDLIVTLANGTVFPVEFKRTDANRWHGQPSGLTLDQMEQCIGEMILLGGADYGDCSTGYVFTRYSFDSTPLCRAWTIQWDEGYKGWFLKLKRNDVECMDDSFPTLGDGRIFYSLSRYLEKIETYRFYQKAEDPINLEPPYPFLSNWRCGKVVKPEFYAEGGKYKGAQKPGTGVVNVNCPLFHLCYGAELVDAGYAHPRESYPLKWNAQKEVRLADG